MNILKTILPKTLKTKLLIALFSIGFFPYLFILIYSQNLGKENILENAYTTHHTQMVQIKHQIESQLHTLNKEIRFLSSLEIMNDMIVQDIDKRITRLLIQKKEDLNLDIHLFTLNLDQKVISSSNTNHQYLFEYKDLFNQALAQKRNYFITDKSVVLFSPIHETLQKNQLLGYMVLAYSFSNFRAFTVDKNGVRSMLYNVKDNVMIGNTYDKSIFEGIDKDGMYIEENYLVLKEHFEGILKGWSIVYMIQKSVALSFMDEFINFIWVLFVQGAIIIAIISLWISKRILEPIATLSTATKSIISTKDYTTQVSISSQGEISELADDFNTMIRATNHAFTVLEEENRLRLLRFIQLINIFNRLIKTQSEEECISVAIDELQTLIPDQNFFFSSHYPDQSQNDTSIQHMMLYVQDFEHDTRDFYGVISSQNDHPTQDPHEEKFYQSIATMIMLQLDQIRLIERTREVSRAKSTFISLMSHELRTPLHTILSAAQYLIGYENLTPDQQDKIATMESSAHHLLGIINDILDLVQIEAGKVSAALHSHSSDDIQEVTQEIVDMLEVLAEQKEIELTFENRLDIPMDIMVDIRLLKQIVINLISNAIKFTQEGGIEVILKKCEENFCIQITDSGVGISPKDLNYLFEDFTQASNNGEDQQKGSGLGLAISRKLAHLLNADLTLESKGEGEGTTAIVIFQSNAVEKA